MTDQDTADQPAQPPVAIGDWRFDPQGQTLERGGEVVRLEHRAGKLLDLLVQRAGQVVARDDMVEAVWNGRAALSQNSVAVVVSDLRKALGDDARNPRFIQTVPKKGYTIPRSEISQAAGTGAPEPAHAPEAAEPPPGAPAEAAPNRPEWARPLWIASAAALVAVIVLAAFLWRPGPPAGAGAQTTVVTINNVRNETNQPRFDDVANTISEIGTAYLSQAGAPILLRDRWDFAADDPSRGLYEDFGADARVLHISSSIVLDGGEPQLVMFANDPKTDEIVWAYDGPIGEGEVRPELSAALDDFLAHAKLTAGE